MKIHLCRNDAEAGKLLDSVEPELKDLENLKKTTTGNRKFFKSMISGVFMSSEGKSKGFSRRSAHPSSELEQLISV